MSEIAQLRSPKKMLEADLRIGQSKAFLARQVHRTVQSVAFKKKRQGCLLVQSDSSGRTTRRTARHTDKLLWLSQSKAFGVSFGRTTRQDLCIGQSYPSDRSSFGRIFVSANHILRTDHPSDESSYRPIISFGQIILRTDFRLDQSHPLVGLSLDGLSSRPITSFGWIIFRRTFISTNHILRSDYLWTDCRLDQSETLKIITSLEWSWTARVTRSRSPDLVRYVISNDLRSHERDGQKRRKKSLRAKAVRLRTH